jgi:hypothetical protein
MLQGSMILMSPGKILLRLASSSWIVAVLHVLQVTHNLLNQARSSESLS